MSNAYFKRYDRAYHDEKQAPASCKVRIPGKNRRKRPYVIEYRWLSKLNTETQWRKHHRYRTEAERDAALKALRRKHPSCFEYRAV